MVTSSTIREQSRLASNGMENRNQTVFVGLSGGVDSSVTAALLKAEGYHVVGAFIKVWSPDWLPCTWKEERRDAMRAAAVLDIPFVTIDLEQEYKQEVADYMIEEYRRGRTPNPDVMCNKAIKFGGFLREARKQGADFVATGHYVEKTAVSAERKANSKNNTMRYMLNANRSEKDQSYFLWTLTQDQLAHSLFPVGQKNKDEIRKLAQKFNLPTANKKDSQGICFLGKLDMKEFLKHYISEKPGEVLNEERKVIGTHSGALFFTIGERHGFEITHHGTDDEPLYVIGKNLDQNTITVAPKPLETEAGSIEKIELEEVNWIAGKAPATDQKYQVRFRYRQQLIDCQLEISGGKTAVIFDKPQSGVSVGQSAVIYNDAECLGGGIIVATSNYLPTLPVQAGRAGALGASK